MKKTGVCPKCQSDHILVFETKEKNSKKATVDFEVVGAFSKSVFTSRYVCCNCGFTERYFDDESLELLKKKFNKIRG